MIERQTEHTTDRVCIWST